MMNVPAAANSCDEFGYGPAAHGHHHQNQPPPAAALLPIMDQDGGGGGGGGGGGIQREQLGYNLEPSSLALLPPSNAAAHHASVAAHAAGAPHDILQFYPTSHYLSAGGNPYGHHFAAGSTAFHQSYYQQPPQATPEYYFPTLVSSAEENMASFAATQLGLNLGYRTYFPPRGGYTYGHHPPRCQAEGCKADLSSAKRYHRRHKVCEHHSKAPVVITAGGLHQRFCQQCSRFHLLDEFDDAKKSCRKRLADHNRRRRKSKPSDAGEHAAEKRRAQANKAATAKDKAGSSSSKNLGIGDGLETQLLGSALMSKDQDQTMGLGEVVKEAVDPKGKASMQQQQQQQQAHHHGGLHQQQHGGFPFPSSSGSCLFPQSQAAVSSTDTTSNIAQVQEPSLAFHQHHQHSNILQLGQAMFDLDFDH